MIEPRVDTVLRRGLLVATMDDDRRELPGGWVAIDGGLIHSLGTHRDPPPPARESIDCSDCLITPGLINTHHHLYQNLTRAFPPMTGKPLFGWLQSLYPLWRAIDEESVYVSTFVGLAELALAARTVAGAYSRYWEPYLAISAIYLVLTLTLSVLAKRLEAPAHLRGH